MNSAHLSSVYIPLFKNSQIDRIARAQCESGIISSCTGRIDEEDDVPTENDGEVNISDREYVEQPESLKIEKKWCVSPFTNVVETDGEYIESPLSEVKEEISSPKSLVIVNICSLYSGEDSVCGASEGTVKRKLFSSNEHHISDAFPVAKASSGTNKYLQSIPDVYLKSVLVELTGVFASDAFLSFDQPTWTEKTTSQLLICGRIICDLLGMSGNVPSHCFMSFVGLVRGSFNIAIEPYVKYWVLKTLNEMSEMFDALVISGSFDGHSTRNWDPLVQELQRSTAKVLSLRFRRPLPGKSRLESQLFMLKCEIDQLFQSVL